MRRKAKIIRRKVFVEREKFIPPKLNVADAINELINYASFLGIELLGKRVAIRFSSEDILGIKANFEDVMFHYDEDIDGTLALIKKALIYKAEDIRRKPYLKKYWSRHWFQNYGNMERCVSFFKMYENSLEKLPDIYSLSETICS